ncbi:glycosyl hydrolase family 28-related protein [Brevibacillus parabrevis]|uniref:glycosyl hydrolase family 28-related protein n=1 Tax=Brevibacillus parabrevis TaxID=54914 RepID=UPI00113CA4B0|nr:glycosyl hydrolase family 28-related protein [Brevibacillus parabrevis]TGV29932.1 endopolygalacturonase [Mesorhizobium sp. M00.F.Ca.ET.186.01.1.1]
MMLDVKSYGARGDGVTDDTQAISAALAAAVNQQIPLYFPPGTYIIEPKRLAVTLGKGKSLVLQGAGPFSVLKRKANSTAEDWRWLFSITSVGGDADSFVVSNLKIDSNARENPVPPEPYAYEHSADFYIRGDGPGSYINYVLLSHIWCTDAVADHFYFAGEANCYVRSVSISDFTSDNRTRTRSDITVTGGLERLNAVNVSCDRFEVELNEAYDGKLPMIANLSNIHCRQQLDLEGIATAPIRVQGSHLVSLASFSLSCLTGTISASTFYTAAAQKNRVNFMRNMTFHQCSWVLHTTSQGAAKTIGSGLTIDYNNVGLVFDGCSFEAADSAAVIDGYALSFDPWDVPAQRIVTVRNCAFDPRLKQNLYLNRCGNVYLENNRYSGSDHVIALYGSGSYPLFLTVDGGDFSQVTGKMFYHKAADKVTLSMKNVPVPVSLTSGYNSDNSSYLPNVAINERIVYVSTPPSSSVKYGGIKGDTLRLITPVNGQPCEWIATTTNKTACTWLATKTAKS